MDLIIWPSRSIDLLAVSPVLAEDPVTGFLNNFTVNVRKVGITRPTFLQEFAWEIIEARIRPQIHIVLLDNNEISKNNQSELFKVCACAIDFVSTHPMKFVIFYDLVNFNSGSTMDSAMQLSYKLRLQTENLSSFARLHVHLGEPLHPDSSPSGALNQEGLAKLARSLILVTNQILQRLND